MKQAILAVAIIGLLARVYFVYYGAHAQTAAQTLKTQQGIAEIRRNMQGSAAEAGEAVPGQKPAAPKNQPAAPAASAASAPAAVAANAERQEIDAAIQAMHLTTIMPGQPGQVIIDKQEYSDGESVPLPKGRKAKVVAVQDDGVQLTCNNMTFHLAAPAGPDLAALRKKK